MGSRETAAQGALGQGRADRRGLGVGESWRRVEGQGAPPRRTAHVPDSGFEGTRITAGRGAVTADLSHVLERGGRDFLVGGRPLGAAERLDAAAHDLTLIAPPQTWASRLTSRAARRMVRR